MEGLTILAVVNEVVTANWHTDTPWRSNLQIRLVSSLVAVIGDLSSRLTGEELYTQQLFSLMSIFSYMIGTMSLTQFIFSPTKRPQVDRGDDLI